MGLFRSDWELELSRLCRKEEMTGLNRAEQARQRELLARWDEREERQGWTSWRDGNLPGLMGDDGPDARDAAW